LLATYVDVVDVCDVHGAMIPMTAEDFLEEEEEADRKSFHGRGTHPFAIGAGSSSKSKATRIAIARWRPTDEVRETNTI